MAVQLVRRYLDPKRFYKSNDTSELPTHFHVGTLTDGPDVPGVNQRKRGGKSARLADLVIQWWSSRRI